MESTDHAGFIKDICQYLFTDTDNKTNCVFIYGAPNAGKTQFLKRLGEIFNLTHYKQTRSHFDCKYKNGKKAPHAVICEEGALSKFFNPQD